MFQKLVIQIILITFFFTSLGPLPDVSAQTLVDLPAPGMMVNRSISFEPLQLKGILVNVKNPLRFDFLIDKGDSKLYGQPLKENITRLAKYFLTCLTVPDSDLWVNLSPYEKERIVPGSFGITLMGKDMLEQDYLLKQIMASLSYPENDLGKVFWQRVYQKSYELYGTTDIPINTFNKVWITPKTAQVYVQGNAAFVVNSQMDVMLEADYKSFLHHQDNKDLGMKAEGFSQKAGAYSQIFRDVILPELRQEINEGKNFAVVRQVYNALILATWYKRHLKDSFLGKMYIGQNKVKGIDIANKNAKEEIFQQYLRAYKKCVYNYIKEDYDPLTQQTVPRKYASGGLYFAHFAKYQELVTSPRSGWIGPDVALARIVVSPQKNDGSFFSFPDPKAEITHTSPFYIKVRQPVSSNTNVARSPKPQSKVSRIFRPLILMAALAVAGFMMTPSQGLADPNIGNLNAFVANLLPPETNAQVVVATPAISNLPPVTVQVSNPVVSTGTISAQLHFIYDTNSSTTNLAPFKLLSTEGKTSMMGGQLFSNMPSYVGSSPLLTISFSVNSQSTNSLASTTSSPLELPKPIPAARADLSQIPSTLVTQNTNSQIQSLMAWSTRFGIAGIGALASAAILKVRKIFRLRKSRSEKPNLLPEVLPKTVGGDDDFQFSVGGESSVPVPDANELAWQQRILSLKQRGLPPPSLPGVSKSPSLPVAAPVENDQTVKKSGLDVMDVLGAIVSSGIAAIHSGWDLKSIGTAFISSLFMTRMAYGVYTFIHENGGHNGSATVQSPRNFRRIWTKANFFANYNLLDRWRLMLPFGKPSQLPGVDLPFLNGKARRFNQIMGFVVTTAAVGAAFWAAGFIGLWLPLFGSLTVASYFALRNSAQTDLLKASSTGRINCGDSGFIWLPRKVAAWSKELSAAAKPTVRDFFPQFAKTGLAEFRKISELRGDQGEGLETLVETKDGLIEPAGFKTLKNKHGRPVVEVAHEGFEGELQVAIAQGSQPIANIREVVTHDRFLTQGLPSLAGLHPHNGVPEYRRLCNFDDGVYYNRLGLSMSIVIENGDNNNQKRKGRIVPTRELKQFYPQKFHMERNVFIEPSASFPNGYYDYLASGDAPELALKEQWYNNQGDFWSAARLAVDEIFYRNDDESLQFNMSKNEVDAMGDFYMQVFEHGHEQIIVRPELKKKNRTLADCFVTAAMVQQNQGFQFQYQALQDFRRELKEGLLREAEKARASPNPNLFVVGNTLNRLQALHPEDNFDNKVERFVDLAVQRFFTADVLEAAKEVDSMEVDGAFGVRIISTKDRGKRGIFWTKGVSVAIAENKEAGILAYNSEHSALTMNLGEGVPPFKEILFLNSTNGGQITETNYNEDTGELDIRAWSPREGRFLSPDELREWRMELTGDNDYFVPPIVRNPKTETDEEVKDITNLTDQVNTVWNNPKSMARQSADNIVDKLESLFIEDYFKKNSRYYGIIQGTLLAQIYEVARLMYETEEQARRDPAQAGQFQGQQTTPAEYKARVAALLRGVQHDKRITSYLKSRLDQIIAHQADTLAEEIRVGKKTEDDLFPETQRIDGTLGMLMTGEIRILVQNLMKGNEAYLREIQRAQDQIDAAENQFETAVSQTQLENGQVLTPKAQGEGLPDKQSVGSGEVHLYLTAFGETLWLTENLKSMLKDFFPDMKVRTESTNKAMDINPGKVGRRTPCIITSLSGAMSSATNLVDPLKQIAGEDNINIITGNPATLLGLAIGQRYYKGAPFTKRIIPTGNFYGSEVGADSEIELLVTQINFVLNLVRRMKKAFPHQRPWGLDLSDENIVKLTEWRDSLVTKGMRLTGVDEHGHRGQKGQYAEHEGLVQNGKTIGRMMSETPIVKTIDFAYIFSVFYLGAPIAGLAYWIEKEIGLLLGPFLHNVWWGHWVLNLHSPGLEHFGLALLDTTLAFTMPWWITTKFYRVFSGRKQKKARMGPPTVVIGDIPVLHQLGENAWTKHGSLAPASMDSQAHGANATDHFGARFLQRVRRGITLLFFGLPEDPHDRGSVLLTASQSNIVTDMTLGWKMFGLWNKFFGKKNKGGPEIFTIGPGDVDPNISHHHMSTGEYETLEKGANGEMKLKPGITERMASFHAVSSQVYARLVAYHVVFNEAFRTAVDWGPVQVYQRGRTLNRTKIFSTPSPKGSRRSKLAEFFDAHTPYFVRSIVRRKIIVRKPVDPPINLDKEMSSQNKFQRRDNSSLTRDGGIDMSSRLLKLNVTGEDQNKMESLDNAAMSADFIKGVVPQVSQVITVTPEMLKTILGVGYLN